MPKIDHKTKVELLRDLDKKWIDDRKVGLFFIFFTGIVSAIISIYGCCYYAFGDLSIGTQTSEPTHIAIGSFQVQKVSVGTDTTAIWEVTNAPNISAFSVSPNSIDLDTRASGNISFTITVDAQSGQSLNAHIVRVSDGANVGTAFTSSAGANINEILPNITQPTHTTTYRLIARSGGGSSHRDANVSVTQNAQISNLRRTGFRQQGTGGNFQFTARIIGTPQPAITWRFGGGSQSQRNNDNVHCTAVSGQVNTWDCVWGGLSGSFHSNLTDSFTMTATNSSNSVSATISNISSR